MRDVLTELAAVVASRRDRRRGHRRRHLEVRAPPARRVDARRPGRHRGRQRVRRLRRGRGVRAGRAAARRRRARCCSATASATTTRSPSGSPAAASSTSSSSRSTGRPFPELGDIADDIEAGRPVAVATLISDVGRRRPGRAPAGRARPDARRGHARQRPARRRRARRRPRPARSRARTGDRALRPGRRAARRRHRGVRRRRTPRSPRMIVFGAIDFAAAVARVGAFLGYRVTVCDARPTFATAKRFPDADEVVVEWPHRYLGRDRRPTPRTVVCVLTHDPKFDVPLLEMALRLPLAYVGRDGVAAHQRRPRPRGCASSASTDAELARLHAPIGLDVGGRTPEETAVSVAAEIIAPRWGGTGAQLRQVSTGPIHRDAEPSACSRAAVHEREHRSRNRTSHHASVRRYRTLSWRLDDQDQRHRRRRRVHRRRRAAHAAGALPARAAGQGRHGRRLRHQQLRCLHRPPRRPEREELHRARRPGRRRRGHHHRGSAGRRTARCTRCSRPSTRTTRCSAATARRA